jgi:hypothetical protein
MIADEETIGSCREGLIADEVTIGSRREGLTADETIGSCRS